MKSEGGIPLAGSCKVPGVLMAAVNTCVRKTEEQCSQMEATWLHSRGLSRFNSPGRAGQEILSPFMCSDAAAAAAAR